MQWDAVENKTAVVVYGAGAVTLLWFSSTIVGAVNNLPLVRPRHAVRLLKRSSLSPSCDPEGPHERPPGPLQ